MPSPAAPSPSRGLALLGLVLIGTLHLAILVAAFAVAPLLTLAFVGAVVASLVALVVWLVPDDGASARIEQRHGQQAIEPSAAAAVATSDAGRSALTVIDGLAPGALPS